MCLIFKTSSGTPDFFYVFNSQSFKKICTWELLSANVLNGEPIWFILTNGNHPMSKVSHSVLLGGKLNQNQPFYQFRNLLHQDRSLKTIKSPFSLLLRYLISLCFPSPFVSVCPRLLTQLFKPRSWKFKPVSWIQPKTSSTVAERIKSISDTFSDWWKKSNFILHYLHRHQNVFFQYLWAGDNLADMNNDT